MEKPDRQRARWRRPRRILALGGLLLAGLIVVVFVVRYDGDDPKDPVIDDGTLVGAEDDLVELLQAGGLVIYQRHAETTEGGVDTMESLASCALQRELSDDGRRDAVEVGEAFVALDIPVGHVVSSPFCRVVETAELAFGQAEISESLLSLATARRDSEETERRIAAGALDLISTPPEPGTNTVLVGSISNVEGVTGVGMEEGGAIVFRPGGDGELELLAVVRPQGWQALAQRNA